MLNRSAFSTVLRLARGFLVLAVHALRGALFETLEVSEWVKRQLNAGQVAGWRALALPV